MRPSMVRTRVRVLFTASLADSRTLPASSINDPIAPASSGSVAMSCSEWASGQGGSWQRWCAQAGWGSLGGMGRTIAWAMPTDEQT
jgi:hypothetical protein